MKKLLMIGLVIMFGSTISGCSKKADESTTVEKKPSETVSIVDNKDDKSDTDQEEKVEDKKEQPKDVAPKKENPKVKEYDKKQENVNKEEQKEKPKKEEVVTEDKPVINKPVKPETPPPVEEKPVPPMEEIDEEPVKKSEMTKEVMNKINAYRIDHGLAPFESTDYYQKGADEHAYAMAKAEALWHEDNGECITNHPDPFNAWVSSAEHNEIILTPNNTKGVVSIYYADGYYYSVFRTSW